MNAITKTEQVDDVSHEMTILGCSPKLHLAKIYDGDTKRDFDEVRNYRPRTVVLDGLPGLHREIEKLAKNPHACVLRGRYVGDEAAQKISPPERPGQVRRILSLFKDTPRRWAMFDVDGRPSAMIDWTSRESITRAVLEFIRVGLPPEFHGVEFVFHASGSAGRNPARLSGHLWYWLNKPLTSEALRAWVRSTRTPVDAAVFNPVQVHYTANPMFTGGARDPVGDDCRVFVVEGIADELALDISPEILLESEERIAAANDKAMPDPTKKPGLIGAFCRAYDIPTVIDEWIPGIFAADDPERPRRLTYLESASGMAGGAFITADGYHVVNKHNGDPFENRAANAFDLVRVYRYGHLDVDAPRDARVTDLPSYQAVLEDMAKDDRTRSQAAAAQAAEFLADLAPDLLEVGQTETATTTDDPLAGLVDAPVVGRQMAEAPDWLQMLDLDDKGNIKPSLQNGATIIEHALGRFVFFNALKLRLEAHTDLPWRSIGGAGFGPVWRDSDDVHARLWVADRFTVNFSAARWMEAIATAENTLARHPVRDYLNGLTWDGVDRISTGLTTYLGARQSAYHSELFAVWLRAAVARVMRPGVKFDLMPILVGSQGAGKSTFLRRLAVRDDWFLDNPPDLSRGKDAKEAIAGFWVVEFSELAAMGRAEVESIKSFVSAQSDDFRPAYGRRTVKVARQGVFAATTNSTASLRDETGNRRFPVIEIGTPNTDALARDVDQLWAQAVHQYREGGEDQRLYLSDEAARVAAEIADDHLDDGDLSGSLAEWLARPVPVGHYSRTIDDIGFTDPDEPTQNRVDVSIVEAAVEFLRVDLSRITAVHRATLRRALRKIKGVSNAAEVRRQGSRYGVQRAYPVDAEAVREWLRTKKHGADESDI